MLWPNYFHGIQTSSQQSYLQLTAFSPGLHLMYSMIFISCILWSLSLIWVTRTLNPSLLLFDLQLPGTHSISKYATSNIISLDFTLPDLSSLCIKYVRKFSDPHYFSTCSHACTQPRENHNTNILMFPLQLLLYSTCWIFSWAESFIMEKVWLGHETADNKTWMVYKKRDMFEVCESIAPVGTEIL